MSFTLTETQRIMKNMVAEFAQKELSPTAEERDQNAQFSRVLFDKLAKQMPMHRESPANHISFVITNSYKNTARIEKAAHYQ